MCLVSVISDWARTAVPPVQWTRPAFDEYQEIIRRLQELDRKLGQPDCEDPAKMQFMKEIDERLRRLEERAGVA